MDGALFWILLLVFYFLFQGLGSRRTGQGTDTAKTSSDSRSGASKSQPTASRTQQPNRELDDALGEIRDLLGGGTQPRERERRTSQQRTSPPKRSQKAESSRPKRRRESSRLSKRTSSTSTFEGASTAEEMSEQQAAMERMAEKMRDGTAIKDELDIEHINIPTHEEMQQKDRSGISREMRDRLRDAASAREGVLIAEVLGPPRSRYSNLKRLVLLKR